MLLFTRIKRRSRGARIRVGRGATLLVVFIVALAMEAALPGRGALAAPAVAADAEEAGSVSESDGPQMAAVGTAPPAEIEMTLRPAGRLSASGRLPGELARDDVLRILPGLDEDAPFTLDATGDAGEWVRALEALSIVLPRLRSAKLRLGDDRLSMEGTLRRGFSAVGAAAALRSALGTGWTLDLELAETDPLPEVVFSTADDAVVLRGVLPRGLPPPQALDLLGSRAGGAGLAGGGEGDAEAWTRTLAGLARGLRFFHDAAGRVSGGKLEVEGVLRPGYGRQAVEDYLREQIADGWAVEVGARETRANEGDRRISLLTGEPENYRRGYWLPDARFPVSAERCREEADRVLADGPEFVDETATLADGAEATVDRLAAVAIRCLNSSDLRLHIAAHTDSVGNDAANRKLSEARAATIRSALVARGVRPEALTADGYGESEPIATNDTAAGRAMNRRLVFEWSEEGG